VNSRIRAVVLAGAGMAWVSAMAGATQVRIFRVESQGAFLAGTPEGVSVDSQGQMTLAPRAERVASVAEPFLLSAAALPDGWVVGTGNAGKVLKIDRQGKVSELFTAPEPEVFALLTDADGTVYAGTSPRGKVYRIRKGKGEVFFDPQETYIWALARGADGSLLVATGTEGKLFRVNAAGKGTLAYDADETHLRSLAALPGGDVLIGTAGEGLVLRLGRDGKARTIYDAQSPEVVAVVPGPRGSVYAGVVSSESSLLDLTRTAAAAGAAAGAEAAGGAAAGEVTVTVSAEGDDAALPGLRKPGATGPRSQLVRISADGVVEPLWSFADETVFSLLPDGDKVWIGTGLEGKLYRYADGQLLLEKDADERQLVALLPGEEGPVFATTNAAALYRITAGVEPRGTYTSSALDAGQVARFGVFRFRGEVPAGTGLRLSFRSGFSAQPDRTWSAWTPWSEPPRSGAEIALEGVPKGRYVQFRAELKAGSGTSGERSPRIYSVDLSYRQENLKPKIELLAALDPGQVLVPATFNPSNQVYEPAHPNRDGIFTSLSEAADDLGGGRTKPLWKKGYQTLRWAAADPNQDPLTYELAFRPAATEGPWRPIVDELKDDYYAFDATALPDGVYRFRLVATDEEGNDPASVQSAEKISDPVVIDSTPPVLGAVERQGRTLKVAVRDALNPVRKAEVSVNAGEWQEVLAADGLLDGQSETLLVPLDRPEAAKKAPAERPQGPDYVLLRVMDAAWNVVTFDLSERAGGER
jgi:hypothetical protein